MPKEIHPNLHDIHSSIVSELHKVNLEHFKLLIDESSKSNTVLITSEPNILKKCLISMSQKYNMAIVERKIN
jgi:hypothetical protein